jgi:hypothetical protein
MLIIEMMHPDGDTPHPRQNLRHTDAGGTGRARADGTGIQHAAGQSGTTPYTSCAHRINREQSLKPALLTVSKDNMCHGQQ